MSSKINKADNFKDNNISKNNNNKRKNRFSTSKPSFLKKSVITSILNTFNDGYYTYRERNETTNSNNILREDSLSDEKRINQKLNRINKTTISSNKFKKLTRNHRNDFKLNSYKKDVSHKNRISMNNTNNSFFRNVSNSRSINKDIKDEKNFNSVINSGEKNKIINKIIKIKEQDKEKFNLIKNKTSIGKKFIYVKKNQIINHNNNNNLSNIILNNNYKTINSDRLNQRFKKINFNPRNITERIIVPKNNSKENIKCNKSNKKFTFNDLKAHNELMKNPNIKENNIIKDTIKKNKINKISNKLKNISNNNKNHSKISKKKRNDKFYSLYNNNDFNNIDKINKTEDNIKKDKKESPKPFIVNIRKNNSVKVGNCVNTNKIITKILRNQFNEDKSIDNSFQKTTTNFLCSKIESININKSNKKSNRYCNILILDNKDKREFYTQTKNHNSFSDKSKLIDYINFKVTNNKKEKEKEIRKSNNNSSKNKSKKIVKKSRNNNKYNFTNSNSITIENNNTNYISPKQFEKDEKISTNANIPLYNKFISINLNNSLKKNENNSNIYIINKKDNNNNNDKKLEAEKGKNSIINKVIHKKKIIHDQKISISINNSKRNNIIGEKNKYSNLTLTPITKQLPFVKKIKLKNSHQIPIIKKVIKIDSCTVSGYSSPGVSKINQDNYFIIKEFLNNKEQFYMGICDGHGSYGHLVSKFICNNLPKKITKISNENITQAFLSINNSLVEESKIDCSLSGSTCCSLIISPDKITSANLGDSRAVLGRLENGQYDAINLTRDHKATESNEMKRILNNGGRIKQLIDPKGNYIGPERIWLKNSEIPGLAMTRSFGDNLAHTVGVIAEPEIKKYDFNGNEKFILLASDGIWEFIDSDECVRIIKDYYDNNMDAVGALNTLVKEAFRRWKNEEDNIDDITAILIFFE